MSSSYTLDQSPLKFQNQKYSGRIPSCQPITTADSIQPNTMIMKKLITIFTLALLFVSVSFAQDIKFGIKGGWNYANLDGDLAGLVNLSGDYVSGFHAGAFSTIGLNQNFAIQPELLFNQFGTQQAVPGVNGNADITLSYLSVPVLLKYYPVAGLALKAGPQLNFLVDDNIGVSVGDINAQTDLLNDVVNMYNTTDFGIQVGVDYEFAFGLTLGTSYYHGLSNVADVPLVDVGNRVVQVSVGWVLL